jgi:hypothetical protein
MTYLVTRANTNEVRLEPQQASTAPLLAGCVDEESVLLVLRA